MIKGNKGEWSEFYAFLKVLERNDLYAADAQLNVIPDKYYNVLKVIREEARSGKTVYDVTKKPGFIYISREANEIAVFDLQNLKGKVRSIFEQMKAAPDTTFAMEQADELMTALHCTQIKASSGHKSDLTLVIHDRISPTTPELGFSIKSMLGSPSTLLNASGGTNFTYQIDNEVDADQINAIEGRTKMRDRLTAIGPVTYENVESETFRKNLRKIDTVFPAILAEVTKAYYCGKGKTLAELVDSLDGNTTLAAHGLTKGDYEFKIKNFLVAIALGMTPQTEWDGLTTAHGGYIIVREDGEIVCYHLYNRDEFQEYLYQNTRLETPSTTRHRFGFVYVEDGKQKIKLNLQIRFVK